MDRLNYNWKNVPGTIEFDRKEWSAAYASQGESSLKVEKKQKLYPLQTYTLSDKGQDCAKILLEI